MNRRSLLAGLGISVAAIGTGAIAQGGRPSFSNSTDTQTDELLIQKNREWIETDPSATDNPYYVPVFDASDADRLINHTKLDPSEQRFIEETDFESAYLLVVEHWPTHGVELTHTTVDDTTVVQVSEQDYRDPDEAYIGVVHLNSLVLRVSSPVTPDSVSFQIRLQKTTGEEIAVDPYDSSEYDDQTSV